MPAHPECVFCKIIARAEPAPILDEDDRVISFLPLAPSAPGHTLVVPKAHHVDVFDTPEDVLAAVLASVKRHALRWRDRVGATGINVLHASGNDAGQSVFHFHVHVLPRFARDGLHAWPAFPPCEVPRAQMHARFRLDDG